MATSIQDESKSDLSHLAQDPSWERNGIGGWRTLDGRGQADVYPPPHAIRIICSSVSELEILTERVKAALKAAQ